MHERRLHVDAEQYAEPDQVDAELIGDGPTNGTTMNESSKIEEERQKKMRMLTTIRNPSWPPGGREQVLDPDVPVDPVERQAEHGHRPG
jgi:hypothetical protein